MKFRMRTALKCGYDPDNPESLSIKDRPTYMTVVESLIHRRADPNASTLEGLTALHLAAHNGNYKSLWALLQVKGLNLDAVSRKGRTAIQIALDGGRFDVAALLLQSGASAAPPSSGAGAAGASLRADEALSKMRAPDELLL
mmetsp:Transcript_88478/g.235428  ORF Transcript_88478/g.235428 Transcript_88478/m.235428 type:complete len:142 (+) Transcript_88478:267-692(+)